MQERSSIRLADNMVQGSWRNVCLLIHRGEPTLTAARACGEGYREMSRQHPDGFAVLVVVERGVPLPGEEVRKYIADLMAEMSPFIRSMCGVYEATGFVGAAMRSMMVAMTLMSRPPYRTHTTGDLGDGCAWLASSIVPSASAAQLEVVVRDLRAQAATLGVSAPSAGA